MSDDHIAALARIAHDATCSHRGGHEDCRVDGWWSDIFRAVLSPEHVPTVIAALVEAGVLGKEEAGGYAVGPGFIVSSQWVGSVRYVTDWETTS